MSTYSEISRTDLGVYPVCLRRNKNDFIIGSDLGRSTVIALTLRLICDRKVLIINSNFLNTLKSNQYLELLQTYY